MKFVNEESFQNLVVEDAAGVKGRQETDSIDIIDEIRYEKHILKSSYFQIYHLFHCFRFVIRTEGHSSLSSAVGDSLAKLDLIDEMLAELGFAETWNKHFNLILIYNIRIFRVISLTTLSQKRNY